MATDKEGEAEIARYVLAYLYNHNYSQTISAFMTECQYVQPTPSAATPSNVLILPSIPLKDIITDYKARQSTNTLVQSLGNQQAWTSLWEKLMHTLTQINNLAQGLNQTHRRQDRSKLGQPKLVFGQNVRSSRQSVLQSGQQGTPIETPVGTFIGTPVGTAIGTPGGTTVRTPGGTAVRTPGVTTIQTPGISMGTPGGISMGTPVGTTVQTPVSTTVRTPVGISKSLSVQAVKTPVDSMTEHITADSRSPRKKTQPSKRRQEPEVVSPLPPIEQVLDALLTSPEIPTKLADLINHYVESNPETREEDTLAPQSAISSIDNLLTCTDSWLDELMSSTLNQPLQTNDDEVTSTSHGPSICTLPSALAPSHELTTNKRLSTDAVEKSSLQATGLVGYNWNLVPVSKRPHLELQEEDQRISD